MVTPKADGIELGISERARHDLNVQPPDPKSGDPCFWLSINVLAWQYWLKRAFQAANNMDSASEQMAKKKTRYEGGAWDPPRVTAIEYLEHCTQMADRFNRMFLRVLRQMRDLRRYSVPVTINNTKQVNVQEDAKAKGRKRKKASNKPQPILKAAR